MLSLVPMRLCPIFIGLALAACGSSSTGTSATLTVQNSSDFAIVDIRLAPSGSNSFGPNLIAGNVLAPGEQLTLGTDCGTFDAHVMDESGAECDLTAIDLCLNDATWVLSNSMCPVFAASAK